MKRAWLSFLVLSIAVVGVALGAHATPPQGTVSITLPTGLGPPFKPGAGAQLAQQYCTRCHSSAYVAIQPPLTAAQWTAEVTKMVHVYGAPIPDDAAATIAQYLAAEYGKP